MTSIGLQAGAVSVANFQRRLRQMKIRRIVSAEGKTGVVMQVSDVLDTETADRVTNIWGFDKIPQLPLSPEQVLGEYKRLGIFGPKDSIRVDLQVVPPETAGA